MRGGFSRSTKRPSAGCAERKVEGVVRLGVMDDYGTIVVPPLLASFLAGYPRIHVEMETGLTSYDAGTARRDLSTSSSPCIRKDAAKANSCAASRPSGRPALRRRVERAGAAAGRALSAGLPVPEMGDRGARRRQAAVAAGLRQPQPRRRGSGRRAGPGGDRHEGRHLSAEASRACRITMACRHCRPPTSACIAPRTCRRQARCSPIICDQASRTVATRCRRGAQLIASFQSP